MNIIPWQIQLRAAFGSAGGILVIWFVAVMLLWALFSQLGRWGLLSLTLYLTTFALDFTHSAYNQIIPPLEQLRQLSEPITFGLFLCLAITAPLSGRLPWHRPMLLCIIALFLFQLIIDFRQGASNGLSRGLLGAFVHIVTFCAFVLGLSTQLKRFDDVNTLIRCIVIAAALFAIGTTIQLMVSPAAIISGNRLEATTSNPQAAALYIAGALPPICYLLIRPAERRLFRAGLAVLAGFLLIFLVWTGSRTGIIVSGVSLLVLFRLRVGKFLFVAIICAVLVTIALQLFTSGPDEAAARLMESTNSRSGVWQQSWEQFLKSPFAGAGFTKEAFHESSYLSVLATMGLSGAIPFALALILIGVALIRLQSVRRELGDEAILVDLITSGLVSMAIAGVFEAIIFGTFSNPIIMILIYLTMLRFVLDPQIRRQLVDDGGSHPGEYDLNVPWDISAGMPY